MKNDMTQEAIDRIENDLIIAKIMTRDDMEQLWQLCHQKAWNPEGDYNGIIKGKWLRAFHVAGKPFPWIDKGGRS